MTGDDLPQIREAHTPQPYEFKTEQTYCPSSDAPTDACHTCIVLAELDRVIPPGTPTPPAALTPEEPSHE